MDSDEFSSSALKTGPWARRFWRWVGWAALLMFVSGFFVARVEEATRPELAPVSAFFVLFLALPSFWMLGRWLGAGRAALVLAALGGFALWIESVAIATGWPYGEFSYGDKIGAKIGTVPWTVPFAWSPLVLGAAALASSVLARGRFGRAQTSVFVGILVAALVAFDGVLDPGAVQQGFWAFEGGGAYYGVPLINYFGWMVSGLCGALLFVGLGPGRANVGAVPLELASSVVLILAFWTSVALWTGMVIPAALGVGLLAWCTREIRSVVASSPSAVEERTKASATRPE